MKKRYPILSVALTLMAVCTACTDNFTKAEKALISSNPEQLMHVLVVDDPQESIVLRTPSEDFNRKALQSETYQLLARRMSTTVQDSTVGGVGIAGPQVGINKRVVVVQRMDRPNTPFVAYPNIHILSQSDAQQVGNEGCLSIPNRREQVSRAAEIVIAYTDPTTLAEVQETITGFTAVIFQHEVDHLEGILYTDRISAKTQE